MSLILRHISMLSQQELSTTFDPSRIVFAEQYRWGMQRDGYDDDEFDWVESIDNPKGGIKFVGLNRNYWIVIFHETEGFTIVSFLFDPTVSTLCNVDSWKQTAKARVGIPLKLIRSPFAESSDLVDALKMNELLLTPKTKSEISWYSKSVGVAFKRWVNEGMPLKESVQKMLDNSLDSSPHTELNPEKKQDTDMDYEEAVVAILNAFPSDYKSFRDKVKVLLLSKGESITPKDIMKHFETKQRTAVSRHINELRDAGLIP